MTAPLRVLLVEDSPDDAALVARTLERAGYRPLIERVEDREGMVAALARGPWDLVIADHSLPRFDSASALAALRAVDTDVGCLIVSGHLGEEAAVEAMRAGADDYVLKDKLGTLAAAVERTLRTAEVRRERHRADGRYKSLVLHAPLGIVTVDREGKVTSLNPAFEEMSGHTLADAVGRHFREFIHAEDVGAMERGFAAALATPAPRTTVVRVRHRADLYFHAELTVARLIEAGATTGLFGIFRDITERRAMERELRLSEARLRTLVESAPDGIYTLAPTGEVQSINPALMKMLELEHTIVGRRFREVVYPDDLDKALDTFSRRLRGEEIPPFEIRLRKQDGTPLDTEITSARLTEGGQVAGTLGIVRDVTARKATAKELELREERFRLVTLATQDAVYDWDIARDTIWWNERATAMFGETPAHERGLEWWAARIHPEDRDRVTAALQRTAEEGRALWADEYRFRHAGGGWRVLMDMGLYLYDEGRTAIRMIGAMSDITDRREAESEQVRLQAALQAAATDWTVTFDAVPMHALLLNAEGRIQRLNRSAREAIGLSWNEVLGREVGSLDGRLWGPAAELMRRAFEADAPRADQFEDPGTGRVWNIVAAPVATSAGIHAVVLLRDTTDLVRLQRTIAHQETMAALGAVVAGVAHEVRNPLFAISATLDAFEARYGKEPEFVKYTGNLRPEVQRLSALMRDLLEYGRPPALQIVAGDVLPVVREAIARSEAVAGARGIEIALVVEGEVPVVPHDPGRLLQVVQNLLDNALVHAPAQSRIQVTLRCGQDEHGRTLLLVVEDQGNGFRTEDLPHVFEPFYSKRRGGTGLGLSIVERLVDQHGGRVRAENRPEGGARVTVQLPIP